MMNIERERERKEGSQSRSGARLVLAVREERGPSLDPFL